MFAVNAYSYFFDCYASITWVNLDTVGECWLYLDTNLEILGILGYTWKLNQKKLGTLGYSWITLATLGYFHSCIEKISNCIVDYPKI